LDKDATMARKYACYHDAIKHILNVGEPNKLTLSQIINHPDFGLTTEHSELPEINKFIRREIRYLSSTLGDCEASGEMKLVEIKSDAGKEHYYYWSSTESRNEVINGEGISDNRFFARAVVFSFIEENLSEFFPPDIMESLRSDLNNAHDEYDLLDGIAGKMEFIPSGIAIAPAHNISERNPKHWNLAFAALQQEFVISADYNSLHHVDVEHVHLSPQRIQYANHKVMLLCFVHELNRVKAYEVSRLLNVSKSVEHTFKHVNLHDVEQTYQFEAVVNVGVKDYFNSVKFGQEFIATPCADNSWKIQAVIKIPQHFSSNKQGPDPFAMANYLCGFGDAIEVTAPDFLRAEMKRRSDNLSQLYAGGADSQTIINTSPHVQTGNMKKLKEIEALCNELLKPKVSQ